MIKEEIQGLKDHMKHLNKADLVDLNYEANSLIARLMKNDHVQLYAELLDVKEKIKEEYNRK